MYVLVNKGQSSATLNMGLMLTTDLLHVIYHNSFSWQLLHEFNSRELEMTRHKQTAVFVPSFQKSTAKHVEFSRARQRSCAHRIQISFNVTLLRGTLSWYWYCIRFLYDIALTKVNACHSDKRFIKKIKQYFYKAEMLTVLFPVRIAHNMKNHTG